MYNLIIPRSFELAGRKWLVHVMDSETARKHYTSLGGELDIDDLEPSGGMCSSRYARLYVVTAPGCNQEYYYAVFWHELFHALFDTMGHEEHDETVIDGMAQLMLQYTKTQRGVTK